MDFTAIVETPVRTYIKESLISKTYQDLLNEWLGSNMENGHETVIGKELITATMSSKL
jgi:hypothetical protein